MNLFRLIPFMIILEKKIFGQISFSKTASQRRTRRRSNRISFQHQFQTENLANFIFTSFVYKIQLQQSADSFQRNLCLLASQSRSFQNRIFPTTALTRTSSLQKETFHRFSLSTTSSFQRTLGNSFQRSSFSRIFPQISSSFRKTSLPRTTFSSSA